MVHDAEELSLAEGAVEDIGKIKEHLLDNYKWSTHAVRCGDVVVDVLTVESLAEHQGSRRRQPHSKHALPILRSMGARPRGVTDPPVVLV